MAVAPGHTCARTVALGQGLEEGEHQVRLGSLVVGFQVPTTMPLGDLCAGDPF
jgi:hypothetical protein